MASTYPELKSVQALIAVALAQPGAALATETHQSFPVPIPSPKGLRVAFFYCPSLLSIRSGLRLLAPSYLALLNAATSKFEELRAVSPSEFGQKHARRELLGAYDMMPEGCTPEQVHAMRARLLALYDVLMPPFAARETRSSPDLRRTAAEFRKLFPLLVERPLLPYYDALG